MSHRAALQVRCVLVRASGVNAAAAQVWGQKLAGKPQRSSRPGSWMLSRV
jgi:hypothetical protein